MILYVGVDMATVDQKLRRLRGAPRQKYIEKWEKWLREILGDRYRDEVGEDIEGFLLEHCSGLDDGECYSHINLRYTGKARETDYYEQICRYQQALANELGVSSAIEALRKMEETDDPDTIAVLDEFIRSRFICRYSVDIDLEYSVFPRIFPTEVMDMASAISYIQYYGYTQGNYEGVWDKMKKYRIIILRDRLRLCKVYQNLNEGILWISNCSYMLLNDRKRTFYYYEYKYSK